jgi:hypothetical protein
LPQVNKEFNKQVKLKGGKNLRFKENIIIDNHKTSKAEVLVN